MKLSDLNKYIRIDLPVDLRNYFKSSSAIEVFTTKLKNVKYYIYPHFLITIIS